MIQEDFLGRTVEADQTSSVSLSLERQGQPRKWQSQPRKPVVHEDDEWTDLRIAKGDVSHVLRRLTPRDEWLLALLGEHGYLTTKDVEALFFPSQRTAELRLRQLRPPISKRDRHGTVVRLSNEAGFGLVMRWTRVDPLAGAWHRLPAVFLLRQKGALVLAAIRHQDAGTLVRTSYNVAEYASQLDHDLGAIAFFTGLARASRTLPDQGLHQWRGEAEMRSRYQKRAEEARQAGKTVPNVRAPDAWGRYLTASREVVFQLEWDAGTEPLATITSKAEGYGRFANGAPGGEFNHILWIADRESRERPLREAIQRARPDDRYVQHWITTAQMLEEIGQLGRVWRHVASSDRVALQEMQGRPRGEAAVSDCLGKPGWWVRRPIGGA